MESNNEFKPYIAADKSLPEMTRVTRSRILPVLRQLRTQEISASIPQA